MPRFLLNPTFDIETGKLLSHDGEFFHDKAPLLFDRQVQGAAKQNAGTANATASTSGDQAAQERGSFVPTLENRAQGKGTGYSPTDLNNMLVAQQEGAGGANATVGGEGRLAALRSRTAGGFAPALDEAARAKGRTLATGGLDVANANAQLKQQQQTQALNALQGLYGTDTSNQLRAMGLSNEDLNTELNAGKSGWLQNTEGVLGTIGGLGSQAAGAYGSLGLGK